MNMQPIFRTRDHTPVPRRSSEDTRSVHAAVLLGLAVTALTLFVEVQLLRTVGSNGGNLERKPREMTVVEGNDFEPEDAARLRVEARPIDLKNRSLAVSDR
jgi:hypothetical protein